MDNRNPPQNPDAEKAVLGSMMCDPSCIDDVAGVIAGDAFYLPSHAALYAVLSDLHADGKVIDMLVVIAEIARRDVVSVCGNQEYMIELCESFGDTANAKHYAELVADAHRRRQVIGVASRMAGAAYDDVAVHDAGAYIRELEDISAGSAADAVEPVTHQLEGLAKWLTQKADSDTIRTGLLALDTLLGGIELGSYVVIAARPSRGKTSLGLNICIAASQANIPCMVISLETPKAKIVQRCASMLSKSSLHRMRRESSPSDIAHQLQRIRAGLKGAPIYLADKAFTLRKIIALAKASIRREGVKIVMIDYLQLIKTEDKSEARHLEVAEISRSLRLLANEMNVIVLALCQLNRLADGTTDVRLSHLRESGAIEQDADIVMFLAANDETAWRMAAPEMSLTVAKNRDGETGMVPVKFQKDCMTFEGFQMEAEPAPVDGDGAPW